ncbi:uncharacterized protein EI90DRAFT_3021469 [Cantharellus anzutake]|uniref:uncharacterized protein n=1 Tax=Cantharellus anzutake TaxID=1750568 RepID=UPI0019088C0A|nr:uncharacterized protein EI90DRAFT_3021469 [Cantharellus anzutake]KAF8316923.1 hypothetical protein EI90DRAFT_3021469 [Cantharellus anzutake]
MEMVFMEVSQDAGRAGSMSTEVGQLLGKSCIHSSQGASDVGDCWGLIWATHQWICLLGLVMVATLGVEPIGGGVIVEGLWQMVQSRWGWGCEQPPDVGGVQGSDVFQGSQPGCGGGTWCMLWDLVGVLGALLPPFLGALNHGCVFIPEDGVDWGCWSGCVWGNHYGKESGKGYTPLAGCFLGYSALWDKWYCVMGTMDYIHFMEDPPPTPSPTRSLPGAL